MRKLYALGLMLLIGFVLGVLAIGVSAPVRAWGVGGLVTQNGDVNGDGELDVSDAVYLLVHMFRGGSPPVSCEPAELLAAREEIKQLRAEIASCRSDLTEAQGRILELEIPGCTDPDADNYSVCANVDDGTCKRSGCTDPAALNYDAMANFDDGSCRYPSDAPGRLHFYTIAPLPPLTIHVPESDARRINNAGQVVGQSFYAVLWQPDGNLVPLAKPNGGYENAHVNALSDMGVAAGVFYENNMSYPLLWHADGQIEALPGGPGFIYDVNNQGVAVGVIYPPGSSGVPVRWEPDGRITELANLPGSSISHSPSPVAINNLGQAVGSVTIALMDASGRITAYVPVPVFWENDGTVRQLPNEFPFTTGGALDINDNGLVVGSINYTGPIGVQWDSNQNDRLSVFAPEDGKFTVPYRVNNLRQMLVARSGGTHVYGDGLLVPLSDLIDGPNGWTNLYPADINDAGAVVGTGNLGGVQRAFIMTPTDRFYSRP